MTISSNDKALAIYVLVEFDHVRDYPLAILALRRIEPGFVDIMTEARHTQIEVWREFSVLQDAWGSVYDERCASRYRLRLMSWGFSEDDADDIVQSILEYTYKSFEKWRPWDAKWSTWFYSTGRWKMKDFMNERRMAKHNVPLDEIYEGEVNIPISVLRAISVTDDYNETPPARIIIEKVIDLLRGGDFNSESVAEILEHALDLGDAFSGFNTELFLGVIHDNLGLTRGQINYRMRKADIAHVTTSVKESLSIL